MSEREIYDIYDVVVKLIGPINPVGESHTDDKRFKNLTVMVDLIEQLLTDIVYVIPAKERHEYSMKKAGEYADNFYTSIGIKED